MEDTEPYAAVLRRSLSPNAPPYTPPAGGGGGGQGAPAKHSATSSYHGGHHHHHYPHQICANCGCHGHMYRVCHQPVSSFGVVCFRRMPRECPEGTTLEYLMVQRKDSLAFVEFVRGKYNIQNRGYLLKLLGGMTTEERALHATKGFDELWHGFWQSGNTRMFVKEYEQSKTRFLMLKNGYYLRPPAAPNAPAPELVLFSLEVGLAATTAAHEETEFGFPKGRRNINEVDVQCAMREFSEETGVEASDVALEPRVGPFEEVFCGSNGVRYRHVYYVAELGRDARAWEDAGVVPVVDPVQLREVKAVGWFDADGVLERLRPEYRERRDMFERLHRLLSNF